MTGEQIDRRTELKEQLKEIEKTSKRDELKSKLENDVFSLTKGTKLSESYNQRAQARKYFEADVRQYKGKARETVQAAIDSGILNNTNRAHELVDLIAKISEDKGITFDFTNNERLKASGFALEGVTVNGYVQNGKVTINTGSQKYLNAVVGHEVMHVLEGSEFASELTAAAIEFAKAAGEYDSRLESLTKLYGSVEGADVNAELVADLVGDYLFTDSKFLKSLSAEKPKLFKRLWDEVKYFVKSVTANTPEAKELVKLEKVFEKAYQDTKKASESGEVRYSLEGYADDGKGLYRSNFPKGTPKRAKSQKILSYIQNVWSKKPIKLNITDPDGNVLRTIDAKFDPTYDESGETISDASKLMGGNRHGNSSEQRVTLDLADDYYQIASDARYNYSKAETGKDLTTHDNVKEWHYFVNDIYFAEYDSDIFEPYRVTINVKEKTDGNYVYSFSAEKNNETSTPRTLHAVVKGTESSPNARFANNIISRDEQIVKHKNSQFEIIEKTNPAPDTYHTWIRSAEEIKTFEETLKDDDWSDGSDFDPDYTWDMAQKALESGEITVYSSYPIEQGVFVTPSRMEAESYSGDGHVYEKAVKLDEVAWIDPTQGMYANVNSKFSLSSDDAIALPVKGDLKISGEEVSIAPPIGENVPRYRTEPLTGDDIAPPREKTFEEKVAEAAEAVGTKSESGIDAERDYLTREYEKEKSRIEGEIADKSEFVKARAKVLYDEIRALKKGVRASSELGYLLDQGYEWKKIKTALLNTMNFPSKRVDQNAPMESIVREMINELYEDKAYELVELEAKYKEDIAELEGTGDLKTPKQYANAKRAIMHEQLEKLRELRRKAQEEYAETINEQKKMLEELENVGENQNDNEITTRKGLLSEKLTGLEAELKNNKVERERTNSDYEQKISELQAEYDSKRDKRTKIANELVRRIERLRRFQKSNDSEYANRIGKIEKRINTVKSYISEEIANNSVGADKTIDVRADIQTEIARLEAAAKKTDAKYERRIGKLLDRIERAHTDAFVRAVQRKRKQSEYTKPMSDLIGNTATWKDKAMGLSYKINTLRRNLRDVVRGADGKKDIAKADAIYDALQGEYNKNEAQLKRESRRIKSPYADMKITAAEDAYIQMLGELRHNPDTELTAEKVTAFYEKHKNKIDKEKVDRAIEMARKIYDELLIRVNEVLREQGMKEIPYRQGYFPHFTNTKQNVLAKLFNWKTQNNEIPTDIAGMTEAFEPKRSWQSFNKERTGDSTDYSFTQGLDTYVHGALDWIYHIEDIQKRRAFENQIRYVHSEEGVKNRINEIRQNEEYDADQAQEQMDMVFAEAKNPLNNFVTDLRTGTNTLAGKKSTLDRSMESATNRKIYSTMTNISNRVSANMVAGSISSALTNFIPITQSWGQVPPHYSLIAMAHTIRSTVYDDGTVDKSDFLTNRLRGEENLHKGAWDKVSDGLSVMFDAVDSFTSQTVWRSKYLQNMKRGMSEAEAIKNADQFAENVIAGRSRGNMPTAFDAKNPLVKAFTAFQLEVNNQYGYMFKDMPQDVTAETKAGKIAKLTAGYVTMFIGAYAYNALYSALTGRDAAFDPIGIIQELLGDIFGGDDEEEKEPTDIILDFSEDVIEELPFVGGLFGGGRIPISSALPYGDISETYTGTLEDIGDGDWAGLTKEWLNPLVYLVSPMAGGQIKKTAQGLSMFFGDKPVSGSYTDKGALRFPVEATPGNVIQSALFGQWASENAREYFDGGHSPLNEKQTDEFIDSGMSIDEYWKFQRELIDLEDKIKDGSATYDDILTYMNMSNVRSEADELYSLRDDILDSKVLSDKRKQEVIEDIREDIREINESGFDNYGDIEYDEFNGVQYAKIGDYLYELYVPDEDEDEEIDDPYGLGQAFFDENYADEPYWRRMDEDQVAKYRATRDAEEGQVYATDGDNHYRWYFPEDEDKKADWKKVTEKELERQNEIGEALGITPYEYWQKKEEYDYAYENPARYQFARAVGGYEAFTEYRSALSDIKSDYDEDGKVIPGSREEKVLDYLDSLDISQGEWALLYKFAYTGNDEYNLDVIDYLNSRRDISWSQEKAILELLKFKVDSSGNITWD